MTEHVQEIMIARVPLGAGDELIEVRGMHLALLLATVISKHFDDRLGTDNINHLARRLIESGVNWTEARIAGDAIYSEGNCPCGGEGCAGCT